MASKKKQAEEQQERIYSIAKGIYTFLLLRVVSIGEAITALDYALQMVREKRDSNLL